jgi:hypothetical protein
MVMRSMSGVMSCLNKARRVISKIDSLGWKRLLLSIQNLIAQPVGKIYKIRINLFLGRLNW